jgi:hypothetical protein
MLTGVLAVLIAGQVVGSVGAGSGGPYPRHDRGYYSGYPAYDGRGGYRGYADCDCFGGYNGYRGYGYGEYGYGEYGYGYRGYAYGGYGN